MATQFVIDLETTLKTKSDPSELWGRMLELESIIEPLTSKGDIWAASTPAPTILEDSELLVTYSLRCIGRIKLNSARIKVHRYCAFSDIPIFSKKHCDLASTPDDPSKASQTLAAMCPCSSTYHSTIQGILEPASQAHYKSSFSKTASHNNGTPTLTPTVASCGILPFSSHFSAKVCLRAAFNIARAFQSLPLPMSPPTNSSLLQHMQPNGSISNAMPEPAILGSIGQPPRMVPMFACCAMQSCYAMVMLSYKSHAMVLGGTSSGPAPYFGEFGKANSNGGNGDGAVLTAPVKKLLTKLEQGLDMILWALRNYAVAYEALGGMRDQVEIAVRNLGSIESQSYNPARAN